MSSITLNFENKVTKNKGFMEIKNIDNNKSQLYIYGTVCSGETDKYDESDICDSDVKNFLGNLGQKNEIEIFINSGGGSVFSGLAIYNQLKRFEAKKTVYIDGIAGSIASVIAMVGDKIFMPANAQMMIHKPIIGLCGFYNADEFNKITQALDRCQNSILQIYKDSLNNDDDFKNIEGLLNNETYLSADECKQFFKNVVIVKQNDNLNNNVINRADNKNIDNSLKKLEIDFI